MFATSEGDGEIEGVKTQLYLFAAYMEFLQGYA
jgi:hypothetical protein